MIIVLKPRTRPDEAADLSARIEAAGCRSLRLPGAERIVIGAIGDARSLSRLGLEDDPMVEAIRMHRRPYVLVGREVHPHDSVVRIDQVPVGGEHFTVIAGPCAIESAEQLLETARAVQSAGAAVLRGGAFKPRSSPYSFQGLGREGLRILRDTAQSCGLPAVTEVLDVDDVEAVEEHAACLQIGARNMQNFTLLKRVGRSSRPVILKRGMAAKVEDLLMAAEYVVSEGNENVILCERGIRTFETSTRNTLDLSAVPFLKSETHLPVLVDPSHGTGRRELVLPMAKAAAACGADGVLIEVHRDPSAALSDGDQSLDPAEFARLMRELKPFVAAAGRVLA